MASAAALDSDIVTDAELFVGNPPSDPLPTPHSSLIKFNEDISCYKELLPYELKEDFIHVLIINAFADKKKVLKFKSDLENHHATNPSLDHTTLNVKLLDDILLGPTDYLDFAFARSFCILLFATARFLKEKWPLLKGYACINECVKGEKENWRVFPVHTALKDERDYKLPSVIDSAEHEDLIYSEDGGRECCERVGMFVGKYKAEILEKERQLYEQRKDHIVKNRENLEKNLQFLQLQQSLSRSHSETAVKEVASQRNTSSPRYESGRLTREDDSGSSQTSLRPTLPPREQLCPDLGGNFRGNYPNVNDSAAHVIRPETLVATPKPGARNVERIQTAIVMSAQTPSDEAGLEVSIQSDSAYGGSEVTSDISTDGSHVDEQRGFPEIPNSDNLISDISRVTIDEDSRSDDHTLTHE